MVRPARLGSQPSGPETVQPGLPRDVRRVLKLTFGLAEVAVGVVPSSYRQQDGRFLQSAQGVQVRGKGATIPRTRDLRPGLLRPSGESQRLGVEHRKCAQKRVVLSCVVPVGLLIQRSGEDKVT